MGRVRGDGGGAKANGTLKVKVNRLGDSISSRAFDTFQIKLRLGHPIFFPSSHYPPDIKCYRQCRTHEELVKLDCGGLARLGAISNGRKLRVTDTHFHLSCNLKEYLRYSYIPCPKKCLQFQPASYSSIIFFCVKLRIKVKKEMKRKRIVVSG